MPTRGPPTLRLVPEPSTRLQWLQGRGWSSADASHGAGKGWQQLPAHSTLPNPFAWCPEMLHLPALSTGEIAVMHIQNKPNMTILDVY